MTGVDSFSDRDSCAWRKNNFSHYIQTVGKRRAEGYLPWAWLQRWIWITGRRSWKKLLTSGQSWQYAALLHTTVHTQPFALFSPLQMTNNFYERNAVVLYTAGLLYIRHQHVSACICVASHDLVYSFNLVPCSCAPQPYTSYSSFLIFAGWNWKSIFHTLPQNQLTHWRSAHIPPPCCLLPCIQTPACLQSFPALFFFSLLFFLLPFF